MSSNSVENKVVNMQFNNAQFEAGVQQTLTSLESLKKALQFNNATAGFSSLQGAVNAFSLVKISDSLDELTNKFSTLGIVGMTALSNITNKAANFVSSKISGTIGAAINQVKTGGWNRAQSVANTRFTLSGLLDSPEDVQEVFDIANDAVTGTAYGLDAAASAASSLVSSGVDIKTKLAGSLKAIAGTAATANADFGDMSRIFTTVAGQGRLMADQLNQLAGRGINAAAVLGKELGYTESEIREMTSKGQISFQMFSDAMESAFGDHAKDANNTFQGVTSNIRAALSRIGEVFASGIIENTDFIQFLGKVKDGINTVNKSIKTLKEPFADMISAISKFASKYFSIFQDDNYRISALEKIVGTVKTGIEYVTQLFDKFSELKTEIQNELADNVLVEAATSMENAAEKLEIAKQIWYEGTWGNGQARINAIEAEHEGWAEDVQTLVNAFVYGGYSWEAAMEAAGLATDEAMTDAENSMEEAGDTAEKTSLKFKTISVAVATISMFGEHVKKVFNSLKTVVTRIGTSFKKVFSWTGLLETIETFSGIFGLWASNLEINEDRADKLERALTGLWSALSLIKKVVLLVASGFSVVFAPAAGGVLDLLLSILAVVGDAITKFNEWIDSNHFVKDAIVWLSTTIASAIATIKEFFAQLVQLPAVQKIKDKLLELATVIKEKIGDKFIEAKDSVGKFFGGLQSEDSTSMETVLDKINEALETLIGFIDKVSEKFDKVKTFYDDTESALADFGVSFDDLNVKLKKTKTNFSNITKSENLPSFFSNLTTAFVDGGDSLAGFGEKLTAAFSNLDTAKVMVFGFAGSIAAFFLSLSYAAIGVTDTIKAFKTLPTSIARTMKSISMAIDSFTAQNKADAKVKVIKAYCLMILAFAAALIALTLVDSEKLKVAGVVMSVLMGIMVMMVRILTNVAKTAKDAKALADVLNAMSMMFISISLSILLVAVALKELAALSWDKTIIAPCVALVVIMASLVGIAIALAHWAPSLSVGGFGLISYAAAVWILVQALKSLETLEIDKIYGKLEAVALALSAVAFVALLASNLSFSGATGVLLIILSIYLIESELMMICDVGVSWQEIKDNLSNFIVVLASLALVVIALRMANTAGVLQAALSVALVAAAIYIVIWSLRVAVRATQEGDIWSATLSLFWLMFGVMAMIAVLGTFAKPVSGIGKDMIGIAVAIGIMALIAYMLSDMKWEDFYNGFQCLAMVVLLEMGLIAITAIAKEVSPKTLFSITACVAILTILVALLSYIDDPTTLIAPTVAICLLLLSLGSALYLAGKEAEKINSASVYGMVLGLAIAVAGLYILSKQPWNQVLVAAAAMSLVLLTLGYGLSQASRYAGSMFTKSSLEAIAMMIAALGLIAASLYVLTVATGKYGIAGMASSALAIFGLMAALVAAMWAINEIKFGVVNKYVFIALGEMIASILVIAVSLSILASTVGDKTGAALEAAAAVGIVIVAMVASLAAINKYANTISTKALVGIGLMFAAVIAIAISLSVLVKAVGTNYGGMFTASAVIGIVILEMVAALVAIANYANMISIPSLVAIGLMMLMVIAIAGSLKVLLDGDYSWNNWQTTIFGLAGCLIALVAAMALVSGIAYVFRGAAIVGVVMFMLLLSTIALTMAPIAAGVYLLVEALEYLTTIQWEKLDIVKIYLLVTALYLIGGACIVGGAGLIALGIGLTVLAVAGAIIAGIFVSMASSLMIITGEITMLASALKVLNEVISNSGISISNTIVIIASSFASGLILMLAKLNASKGQIKNSLSGIIKTVIETVVDGINELTEKILDGILKFLTIIDEKGNAIVEKLLDIIINLFITIGGKAYLIAYWGAYIGTSFIAGVIMGLAASMGDLMMSLMELATNAIASFSVALAENSDTLIDSFQMLALALARVVISAFNFGGVFDESLAAIDAELEYQRSRIEQEGFGEGETYDQSVSEGVESGSSDTTKTIENTTSKWFTQKHAASSGASETVSTFVSGVKDTVANSDIGQSITSLFSAKNTVDSNSSTRQQVMGTGKSAADLVGEGWRTQIMDATYLDPEALQKMFEAGWERSDFDSSKLIRYYQEDIDNSEFDFSSPFNTGQDNLLDMMSDASITDGENGHTGGYNYGEGFFNGEGEWMDKIWDQSYKIGDVAKDGTATSIDSNSPSKVAFSLGKFWDLGMANGIEQFANLVYNASSSMGTGLLTATAGVMSLVSGIINDNVDLQPTITPVVDANSVDAMTGLSNLFSNDNLTMAANTAMSVTNASENTLANQVAALSEQVKKMAETDYSKLLEGVAVNIDASTNVDGTKLRQTSASYTIKKVNDQQAQYAMAIGGRI